VLSACSGPCRSAPAFSEGVTTLRWHRRAAGVRTLPGARDVSRPHPRPRLDAGRVQEGGRGRAGVGRGGAGTSRSPRARSLGWLLCPLAPGRGPRAVPIQPEFKWPSTGADPRVRQSVLSGDLCKQQG
jgi:hypothetical protein